MNIDENKITIMGHRITINDMIDNLYYRTDIAWSKNLIGLKLLYLDNLNKKDKKLFDNIIYNNLSIAAKDANSINPIFKFIYNNSNNDEYYLDIDNDNNNDLTIEYKTINNNYKIKIYQNNKDRHKFFDKDWYWHISYLEPFYSTLKFKIKEEKITRNLRNDMNHNFITITNDIRKIRNIIKNQEIIIKKIIILSFINFFVNIYNSIYNNYYNYE
jgi:hypothetical protein